MNKKYDKCVFAGTFDPITKGHEEIIEKAVKLFGKVTVAILNNVNKKTKYTLEKRKEMLNAVCKKFDGVEVKTFDGLLVDFLKQEGTEINVRGVRNGVDFEYENDINAINRDLDKDILTVYLPCSKGNSVVSSTRVRELLSFGKDVSNYVPKEIVDMLK